MWDYQAYVKILCVILSSFAIALTIIYGESYIVVPLLLSIIALIAAFYNRVLESLSLTAYSLILLGFLSGQTSILILGGIITLVYVYIYAPRGLNKTYYKPFIYMISFWAYLFIMGLILYFRSVFSTTYNLLLLVLFTILFSLLLYYVMKPPEPYSIVTRVARFLYRNKILPIEFLVAYYTVSAMLATHIALLGFLLGAIGYVWGRLMGYDRMVNLLLYTIVFISFLFVFGKIGTIDLYISS